MSAHEYSFATDEDFSPLLELNKTLVPKWFHYDTDTMRGDNSVWGTLSSRERYIHGGPWLSDDTIQVHLRSYSRYGEVLLLKKDGVLIGEIEFHEMVRPQQNLDLGKGSTSRCYHIDWMMINPKFHGRGYGSQMLLQLEEELQKRSDGKICLITEPEDGVDEFYEKNGFTQNMPKIFMYQGKGKSKENSWVHMRPDLYENICANYDVSIEYSRFQLETEVGFADLFNVDYPISWVDLNENIKAVRHKSSVFTNRYKLFFTCKEVISDDQLIRALREILQATATTDQLNISLPFALEDENWNLTQSIPKLIKILR